MPSEYPKITSKEVLGLIYQALEQNDHLSWISQISMATTSTSAREKYAWLGQVPTLREWKGGRVIKRLSEYDYSITNKKYEATLGIQKDDLDREKVGQIQRRVSEFAMRERAHWASLTSTLLTANGTCYDGQAFFSASHSEGDSGTQNNLLTKSTHAALNFDTSGKPTAIEMSAALLSVIGHFYTLKDDVGEPINEFAGSFVVVVPTPDYFSAAQTAISKLTVTTSGGASVDNPLMGAGFNLKAYLNPRLAASSSVIFYVFRIDAPVLPIIRQQEGPTISQVLDENSDHFFKNDEILYGIKTKRAAGYGMWQYALSCDGTT